MKQYSYGDHEDQFVRVHLPEVDGKPPSSKVPLVFIVHGGFWKQQYNVGNTALNSLAPFFLEKGFAACEVEYRRGSEGGWPVTNEDCLAALTSLKDNEELHSSIDFDAVTLLGHSAGGQLVLWLCAQKTTPLNITPKLCVALSPCADLAEADRLKLSDTGDAVEQYMK